MSAYLPIRECVVQLTALTKASLAVCSTIVRRKRRLCRLHGHRLSQRERRLDPERSVDRRVTRQRRRTPEAAAIAANRRIENITLCNPDL